MEDHWSPALFSLQSLQLRVLQRIACLESSILDLAPHTTHGFTPLQLECSQSCEDLSMEEKLGTILRQSGVTSYQFKRVPSNYYDRTFEERRDLLGAASVDHLCKSIVMVNTQAHESVRDCSDYNNSKFYVVIVQYTARLNAEKVKQFVYSLNNGKIPKKRFNNLKGLSYVLWLSQVLENYILRVRLAPEDEAYRLTGFSHNAVTPIGMKSQIPVILSDAIPKLQPNFFWLGGGEVDLKLGVNTEEFIKMFNPFIAECT